MCQRRPIPFPSCSDHTSQPLHSAVFQIHSVHQRREVPGRAKDFDVLVAELKASSRKGESPKEKSPARKEPALERPSQEPPTAVQGVATVAAPNNTFSSLSKQTYPYCALPRYVQNLKST